NRVRRDVGRGLRRTRRHRGPLGSPPASGPARRQGRKRMMPSLDEFVIPRVLLAIAVIVVVARVMGRLFARFRQPPVVGEIVGGILLGPTLLGLLPGHIDTVLFPEAIRGHLSVVANLGLVTFMFLVGLELDFSLLKGKARSAATISISSIV